MVLESLMAVLKEHPWQTKYVVFASPRQADTALRALARLSRGWANAHGTGISRLALMLAEPALSSKGLSALSPVMFDDMVERAWASIEGKKERGVPLSLGPRTPGAVKALSRTITDLRMGGVDPSRLQKTSPALAAVLRAYLTILADSKSADRALLFQTALEAPVPEGAVVIMAGGLYEKSWGLERRLLDRITGGGMKRVDLAREGLSRAGAPPADPKSRLSWVGAIRMDAPAKKIGPEVAVFKAASPWCEVREIFRRTLAGDGGPPIELGDVEIALAAEETYAPLVYEAATGFGGDPLAIVTFAHGIHARHTRPARCLSRFLAWIDSDFEAAGLHALLSSGDLPVEGVFGAAGPYAYRLARTLRRVGAFSGLKSGARRLSGFLATARDALESAAGDEDGEGTKDRAARRHEEAGNLSALFERLTAGLESVGASSIGDACLRILGLFKPVSGLEAAAITALFTEVSSLREVTAGAGAQNLVSRFREAVDSVRVNQSHPEPGRIHVTDLASAGLDGRPVTFLPGLDDANYPGAFLQDPFLRDGARRAEGLPMRRAQFDDRGREARGALARIRGRAVFSWPARDPGADRGCFPSRLVLDAWRLGPGEPDAPYSAVNEKTGDPASYRPGAIALSSGDELLARGLFAGAAAREKILTELPEMARGLDALKARSGDEPTVFDGCVGGYRDPREDKGFVLSCSRLRTLAECPRRYFIRYVLGIEAPEDLLWDPLAWLDAAGMGTLLHAIYQAYGEESAACRTPDLRAIAKRAVEAEAARNPPPSEIARETAERAIDEGLQVFEAEWKRLAAEWTPKRFELEFGIEGAEFPAVEVPASTAERPGAAVMIRGRIDRVDAARTGDAGAVWDYKTGAFRAPGTDFLRGALLQPVLYAIAAGKLLKMTITTGGFLHVGRPGQRVTALCDCGAAGRARAAAIVGHFSEILARGVFYQNPGNQMANCAYCDYVPMCAGPNLSARKQGLPAFPDLKEKNA